jgi:hypothetical protein
MIVTRDGEDDEAWQMLQQFFGNRISTARAVFTSCGVFVRL